MFGSAVAVASVASVELRFVRPDLSFLIGIKGRRCSIGPPPKVGFGCRWYRVSINDKDL